MRFLEKFNELKMPTPKPSRKVAVGALAGAISIIIVWIVSEFIEVPSHVASAFTTIITAIVSYLVPPSSQAIPIE